MKKIYLHVGCKHSEPWDQAFIYILNEWKISHTICNLQNDNFEGGIFIGRINEYCRHLKKEYHHKKKFFDRMWPEPLAMHLYDDKFAQLKFLKSYPTPFQDIAYSKNFKLNNFEFPIVIKKTDGSASKNVYLAHNKSQIKSYPCIIQEFCKNNTGDYRIVIIGKYAMGTFRRNKKNDFRASGSNDCVVLDELPLEAVQLAYKICKKHNFITMAFDFLKLRNKWVICEMSYTYPIYSITKYCLFYIDVEKNERIEKIPNAPKMILTEILKYKMF